MSYRRDSRQEEAIPLPIETVYNSVVDAITAEDGKSYFRNGIEHFNRIYFKYPPEWRTSNVGEKIIGVRNMKINVRQRMALSFVLYIRKYRQDKFNELAEELYPDDYPDVLNDDQIQDVVNRMDKKDIKVFKIPYSNDIIDDIDNFTKDLLNVVDQENIYNKLRDDIYESEQEKDDKIAAYEQLDCDKDNYYLMCLRNDIPFYLNNDNVGEYFIDDFSAFVEIGDTTMLTFKSPQNDYDEYYVDFMMTADNDDSTYKKFYMWDDNNDEPLPYANAYPAYLDEDDRFDFDTACYFHIGDNNPYRNSIHDITKFHREIVFKHILTNSQCEVAASFANQSNHNIIGRTNESYTPIKYYKLNDNDDKFWIELYDRNEINIPVAFEDFFVFTMDVVFLQNRKLIYS